MLDAVSKCIFTDLYLPGWMFPSNPMEINGPAYILLPTEPLTCLAVSLFARWKYLVLTNF